MNQSNVLVKPFARIALLALPLIGCVISMSSYFPATGDYNGFKSFILAMEFVESPQAMTDLLQGKSAKYLSDIDTGNYIDFGFMILYSLFLFLFCRIAQSVFGYAWLFVGSLLAIVALGGDFYENLYLLDFTKAFQEGGDGQVLATDTTVLNRVTWIKWGSLAITFALIGLAMLTKKGVLKILGLALFAPMLLSAWALSTGTSQSIELFSLSIFVSFGILIIFSFWYAPAIEDLQ